MQFLSEVSVVDSINFSKKNMYKKFIAFFLAELNSKTLQERERNDSLFNFVWGRAQELQQAPKNRTKFYFKIHA